MGDSGEVSILSGKNFEEVYAKNNYLVEESEKQGDICAIYFSSAGIYFPNTEEQFINSFITNDKYEWFDNRLLVASKHIFVRDVAKQFYISGINYEVNSIDKLIDLLKRLTKGYEIITVGSSAGAYMATVAGMTLNAKAIFCFSGYFNLRLLDQKVWPYIGKYWDSDRNKWFNISESLQDYRGIFIYFYPALNEGDKIQAEQISLIHRKDFYVFPCCSSKHGVPFSKMVLKKIFRRDVDSLKQCLNELVKHADKELLTYEQIIDLYDEIIIFGSGKEGESIADKLSMIDKKRIYIWDNNSIRWEQEIKGIKISGPHKLYTKGLIVISSSKYEEEIFDQISKNDNYGCDVIAFEELFCPTCRELDKVLADR